MGPRRACRLRGEDQDPGGPTRRQRSRRCLLAGCERWFEPVNALARYCSEGCRAEARRWQNWKAAERYRASERGKEVRRAQSRRRRTRLAERGKERARESLPALDPQAKGSDSGSVDEDTVVGSAERRDDGLDPLSRSGGACVLERETDTTDDERGAGPSRVGHQRRHDPNFFSCDRPGCYELRRRDPRAVLARFCSARCRQALRAVRRREARFFARLHRRVALGARDCAGPIAKRAAYRRASDTHLSSLSP